MSNVVDLTGRVALVFGATSGLGREIAHGLAEHGAHVVPTGRRIELLQDLCRQIGSMGRETLLQVCDVTDQASVRQIRDRIRKEFGQIDILVNAFGVTFRKPTNQISDSEWSDLFESNLTGMLHTCQELYPALKASGKGRVINVASLGSYVAFHEVAAYCASKAAVLSLTRSLACEWAADGICVNALAPGVFPTELNSHLLHGTPRAGDPHADADETLRQSKGTSGHGRAPGIGGSQLYHRALFGCRWRLSGLWSECLKLVFVFWAICGSAFAETGYDAWLRYHLLRAAPDLPSHLAVLNSSAEVESARHELKRGVQGMFNITLAEHSKLVSGDMIVIGTTASLRGVLRDIVLPADLQTDGYWLKTFRRNGRRILLVTAINDRGVIYGVFALLRHLQLQEPVTNLNEWRNPAQPIRWVNEWNNLDGSIERGYAGKSIFFADGHVVSDLTRARDYARLLASIGINGCTVNNVNANPRVLAPEFLAELARIAAVFRSWGVNLSISVPFNSPKTAGGLDTFDPQNPRVIAWWQAKADEIYRDIPDLAGFVVKADSEGQLGPSTYGRSHAEAANVLADALRPHHGILVYRGFVYNHHLDWTDLKNDRAKASYDNFHDLDGHFAENAVLQVKYGPIDFQAREPVSPLIGAMPRTNLTLELQITQEYTGQQRHLCYLVPLWKQLLDFDLHAQQQPTPVRRIVSGKTFARPLGGIVGVSNVGLDTNWMGSDLAQANLYGFGRLVWDPELAAETITSEWTRMTWSDDPKVVDAIMKLELGSWRVYEGYTGPLGLGTLTDILHGHYGPGIETAERNGWGQWIRADHAGIGMDRTVATGTGFIGQYSDSVAQLYETLARCPDELLLFMHHVPYTHVLHSGKALVQEIYDSHYAAAAEAADFPELWQSLQSKLDGERYQAVLARLDYQAGHAVVWRDAICQWFQKQSGIADQKSRVGHDPYRIEAEGMDLDGFTVVDVKPWEDASAGRAISCSDKSQGCTATSIFNGAPGLYRLRAQYFDLGPNSARFSFSIAGKTVKAWSSRLQLPTQIPDGDTSNRESLGTLQLKTGDVIRLTAVSESADAALDYVEIIPVVAPGNL